MSDRRNGFPQIAARAAGHPAVSFGSTVLCGLLMSLFLVAGALPAQAYLVHGIVYGDSSPLASATVDLADSATAAAIGSVVTNAAGSFSFSVPAGHYDLRVSAAGYLPSSVKSIAVVAANVTQDVSLMRKIALSGVVRTFEGVPVAGAQVELRGGEPNDSSTWLQTLAGPVTTNDAGEYAFDLVPSGTVILDVQNSDDGNPLFPAIWDYWAGPFAISGTMTKVVTLPKVATISGTMSVAGGTPVSGCTVQARNVNSNDGWYARSLSRTANSDSVGQYAVRVFATGNTHITATPPPGQGWSTFEVTLAVHADTARDFVFAASSLSGVVRTVEGVPVAGAKVEVRGGDQGDDRTWLTTLAGPVTTNAAGEYTIDLVPNATVILDVQNADDHNPLFPASWDYWAGPFAITGTSTKDLTLPRLATVSGTMSDTTGSPIPGGTLQARNVADGSDWYARSLSRSANSDSVGQYAVRVFATGDTHVTATPPPGHGWSAFEVTLDVHADTVRNFFFQAVTLAGVVRTFEAAPVAGARVAVLGGDPRDDRTWLATIAGPVTTNSAGAYAIAVVPNGSVILDVQNGNDGNPLFPASWDYWVGPFAISGTLTKALTLPKIAIINGKTTDANGVPVRGVEVIADNVASGAAWYAHSRSRRVFTDAAGGYVVRAFAIGGTSFIVTPPAASGFSSSAPVGFSVDGDRSFDVVLMFVDTAAPVILTGPAAAKITDTTAVIEWQTDEPARGGTRYGLDNPPGTQVDETDFATAHAVALSGLLPGTVYYAEAFATDFSGNGPVRSGVISFTTLPAADLTPPVFTFGPIVSSVTHTGAVAEWATDEAARCTVFYGETGSLVSTAGDGWLAKAHRIELKDLLPTIGYELRVDCADSAANAASSAVIPFTTAAAPDTTPPAIVEGPLVIDITATTATVAWTTDEPANSGVSWNNGTKYGLVNDPALVTTHSVIMTGLLPATAYVLTVSTTDGAGNGPTLSAPIPFTTKAAGDTRPPVIVAGPTVVNVTHQSAVIRWETDEPVDGVVEYGLAVDRLLLRDAHAALTRPHNQTLTGLAADTLYFFRVCSADAAGNTACSAVASFTTEGTGKEKEPQIVAGPTVTYSSDRTAAVAWSTDVPTDSVVQYQGAGGSMQQRTDGEKVLEHQITLKNLDPATEYTIRISGADAQGGRTALARTGGGTAASDTAIHSTQGTPVPVLSLVTAAAPDATPPIIVSGPTVTAVGRTQAVVQWETDEIADSVVRFGRQGTGRKEQAGSISRTTLHRVMLTNLVAGKVYDVRVRSVDPEGNGPTESGTVSFTAAATAPLFEDTFADGTPAGDPHWQVGAGSWSVDAEAYVAGIAFANISRITFFDPAVNPFAAGVISTKVTLVDAPPQKANGAIVFSYQDPSHYRYVRLLAGKLVIGQAGQLGGIWGGVKTTIPVGVALNEATALSVKLFPNGWVSVTLGTTNVGSWRFPTSVPGGLGLAAVKAPTIFDDMVVWDAARL